MNWMRIKPTIDMHKSHGIIVTGGGVFRLIYNIFRDYQAKPNKKLNKSCMNFAN